MRKIDYLNPAFSPETLVDLVRWRAQTKPNQRAYTYLKDGEEKEIRMTYGELDLRARAIAAYLQKKGLTGERALLLYPPGLDYITGFFGCLYAGVIAVPAYPPDPNRLNRSLPRLQAIVRDAQATVALTTDSIMNMIRILKLGNKVISTLERVPFLRKFRTTMKYFAPGQSAVAESHELGDLQWISTDSITSHESAEWLDPAVSPETICFLQYTSGSTGDPKGVILTHHNLLANSEIIYKAVNYKENYEGVFWLPIYHDMGLIGGVLQPLFGEIPSTLMSPIAFLQKPLRWLEAISRIQKDRMVGTAAPNFAYDLCVKKATPEKIAQFDFRNWYMALSGAEPVRSETLRRFAETFAPAGFKMSSFLPAYGLAEATLFVTGKMHSTLPTERSFDRIALKKNKVLEITAADPAAVTLVSSGINQEGQSTKIVNPDTFAECASREIGEIWVKGPSVSRGYYSRAEATKETFHNFIKGSNDGPYLRTGDLGFEINGEFFIAGRVKDLIIIRGTNHYPQDIELTVEHCHPEIRPGCSAVFTVDENDQEELVIVAEIRHQKNTPTVPIINAIRQMVTENHDLQAKYIVLIKPRTIHKTSSGKIMRRATKADFLEEKLAVVADWKASKRINEEALPALEPVTVSDLPESSERKTAGGQEAAIEQWLTGQLAELLGVQPEAIDTRQPFVSFGLDSAQAVGLAGDLEDFLGEPLPPTIIWDYPTIEALAAHLANTAGEVSIKSVRTRPADSSEAIAVTGIGLRFPAAANVDEFWRMLENGLDGISEVPAAEAAPRSDLGSHRKCRNSGRQAGRQPDRCICRDQRQRLQPSAE